MALPLERKCAADGQPTAEGRYLCPACWYHLSYDARVALRKRDELARLRLLELYRQLFQDVPLSDIRITP